MFLHKCKFSMLLVAGVLYSLAANAQKSPLFPPKSPFPTSGIPLPASTVPHLGLMQPLDPLKPQTKMLLKRVDVQRELGLNARQTEQILPLFADLETQRTREREKVLLSPEHVRELAEYASKMQRSPNADRTGTTMVRGVPNIIITRNNDGVMIGPNGPIPELSTPVAREIASKLNAVDTNLKQQQQQQLDTILTAPQQKRLRELELQWRGPFALLDKPVAERLSLPTDAHDKLEAAFNHYKAPLGDIDQSYLPQIKPLVQPNTDMSQNPAFVGIIERERKTVRKARNRAEMDTLVSLPIPVQLQWRDLTGKPFAFRLHDLPGDAGTPRE